VIELSPSFLKLYYGTYRKSNLTIVVIIDDHPGVGGDGWGGRGDRIVNPCFLKLCHGIYSTEKGTLPLSSSLTTTPESVEGGGEGGAMWRL